MDLESLAENDCEGCGGECCRYVVAGVDNPEVPEDYARILQHLHHRRVMFYINEGEWYIQFETDCEELNADGKCEIYSRRPNICREFDSESCDRHGHGKPYDRVFRKPKDLIKYAAREGLDLKRLTKGCVGLGCEYITSRLGEPEDSEDCDEILWFLHHRNIGVFVLDEEWYIQLHTNCEKLNARGRCEVFKKRPDACAEFDCRTSQGEERYDRVFTKPEQFIEYAREKGFEWDRLDEE